MPTRPKRKQTEDEWLRELGALREEALLPGFWTSIEENAERWARELSVGELWEQTNERLDRWRTEYRSQTGADLLVRPGMPPLVAKPATSIRNKLYRRCQEQPGYISKALPASGPPVPRMGDLIRTRVACRYIDGVEFLADRVVELCSELGLSPTRKREGRLEGYFAQHVMVPQQVIFRLGGASSLASVMCEVQIASELATRMWHASHPLYERSRNEEEIPEEWQWQPTNPRFISNQLGHMLHLADGLLVQLRELSKNRK